MVFEPSPMSCCSDQRVWLEKVAGGVFVLSFVSCYEFDEFADEFRPNHEELLSFYSHDLLRFSGPSLRPTIEKLMRHLLNIGVGTCGDGIVAVRCGRMGSCIGTRTGGLKWFPAYFDGVQERRVTDVTGGKLSRRRRSIADVVSW